MTVENTCGIRASSQVTWENESGPRGAGNTAEGLTERPFSGKEAMAVNESIQPEPSDTPTCHTAADLAVPGSICQECGTVNPGNRLRTSPPPAALHPRVFWVRVAPGGWLTPCRCPDWAVFLDHESAEPWDDTVIVWAGHSPDCQQGEREWRDSPYDMGQE